MTHSDQSPAKADVQSDSDRRIERIEEREADRRQARARERMAEPLDRIHGRDYRDVVHDLVALSDAGTRALGTRRRKVKQAAAQSVYPLVNPFGAPPQKLVRQVDPFGHFDSRGRKRRGVDLTDGLTSSAARSAYERVLRANATGLVLSVHITIAWSMVDIRSDAQVLAGTRRVASALRESNRFRKKTGGAAEAWLWTLEKSSARGLHTHMLVGCEPVRRTAVLRLIARAVRTFSGASAFRVTTAVIPFRKGVSSTSSSQSVVIAMTEAPAGSSGLATLSREVSAQWALWRYIFKGVLAETAEHDAVHWQLKHLDRGQKQGRIVGQRWGYSTSVLGGAAWLRLCRERGADPDCIDRHVRAGINYPRRIGDDSPIWDA